MRFKDISKEKLDDIASLLLKYLIENTEEEIAIEFMYKDLDMTYEECKYFSMPVEDYKNKFDWDRTCPLCNKRYSGFPALSIKDNHTEICSECGTIEAVQNFIKKGDKIMKKRYEDVQKQSAYENAYDCLLYGYGEKYWNNCGLNESTSEEVWKQAFVDICNED